MIEHLVSQLSTWTGDIANLLPLGYAFGAGMVSTVNPCGFAMLPAYLGLYLGSRDLGTAGLGGGTAVLPTQIVRSVLVSVTVTAGFVLLFGGVGLLVSAGGRLIVNLVPWVALGIGGGLVVLGVAGLRGHHISADFAARWSTYIGDPRTISFRGFFLFGVAFALASLSCTLPIFLTVVGASLAVQSFLAAALQFVLYALGMGLVILALTLGIGVFRGALVGHLRRFVPYVERVSAVLLIVAGGYIVYYWLFKGGLISTLT